MSWFQESVHRMNIGFKGIKIVEVKLGPKDPMRISENIWKLISHLAVNIIKNENFTNSLLEGSPFDK